VSAETRLNALLELKLGITNNAHAYKNKSASMLKPGAHLKNGTQRIAPVSKLVLLLSSVPTEKSGIIIDVTASVRTKRSAASTKNGIIISVSATSTPSALN
jgi:hypothetical protein